MRGACNCALERPARVLVKSKIRFGPDAGGAPIDLGNGNEDAECADLADLKEFLARSVLAGGDEPAVVGVADHDDSIEGRIDLFEPNQIRKMTLICDV